MNIYIFENVEKVSKREHSGGGLAIVAADLEHVKQLVGSTNGMVVLSEADFQRAIIYPLGNSPKAKMFVFLNAGCC